MLYHTVLYYMLCWSCDYVTSYYIISRLHYIALYAPPKMTPTFDPNGNPLKLALATLLMQAVWDCCLEVFGAPRDALRGPLLGPIRPMPYGAPKDDPHKAYALARVWEKQPVLNVHFPLTMFTSTL